MASRINLANPLPNLSIFSVNLSSVTYNSPSPSKASKEYVPILFSKLYHSLIVVWASLDSGGI